MNIETHVKRLDTLTSDSKSITNSKHPYLLKKKQEIKKKKSRILKSILPAELQISRSNKDGRRKSRASASLTHEESIQVYLRNELEDFKSYLYLFLQIKDKSIPDKIKEFDEATKQNPCCKLIHGFFNFPELI